MVPTHNRVRKLLKLLTSFNQLHESPEQIIIVNDGSTDKTSQILREWEKRKHGFSATVIENPRSKGLAISRNIGINASHTDLIVFADDEIPFE